MPNSLPNIFLVLTVAYCFSTIASAQQKIDFETQVSPILKTHCIKCHGAKVREGGLRFTNRQDALLETDSNAFAIVPGKPGQSHLLDRIISTDESTQMPPEGERLSKAEISTIRQWITEGAIWPETNSKKHWAYIKPKQSELPKVKLETWPRNAIDYFVLNQLEENDLAPSPQAEPARLLRRSNPPPKKRMKISWINALNQKPTANVGRSPGLIWRGTRTPTTFKRTSFATVGLIATG